MIPNYITGIKSERSCQTKRVFKSEEESKLAAEYDAHHGIKLKPYWCRWCTLWHLTSKKKKKHKRKNKENTWLERKPDTPL